MLRGLPDATSKGSVSPPGILCFLGKSVELITNLLNYLGALDQFLTVSVPEINHIFLGVMMETVQQLESFMSHVQSVCLFKGFKVTAIKHNQF